MRQEIKPCPFCGDVNAQAASGYFTDIEGKNHGAHSQCYACGATGPDSEAKATRDEAETAAIAAWNKRAQPAGEAVDAYAVFLRAYRLGASLDEAFAQGLRAAPPAAANQAGIPEGLKLWKPMPVEPTLEMRAAAADAYLGSHGYGDAWIVAVYAAMLAAAPHTESHALGGGDVVGNGEA